jgi:RNA polymerase sigma-54 factor
MAIKQILLQKQTQRLVLTPALQAAIKLLPMSRLELVDMLNQEVVANPLLEDSEDVTIEESQHVENIEQSEKSKTDDEQPTEERDPWDDSDYEDFFGEYLEDGYRPRVTSELRELAPIENRLRPTQSLFNYLKWQLSGVNMDETSKQIAEEIIGNINDDGYLAATLEEIGNIGRWPESKVKKVLRVIQQFDPIGVAARNPQECLLLQLEHLGIKDTYSGTIVRDHLRLLQTRQLPELATCLGITVPEVKQHIQIIQLLDPKPGLRHNPPQSQYVVPDIYIKKSEGEYVADLNEDGLPKLRISRVYRRLLEKNTEHSDETRSYVREKFRSALWLIKSIDQRQKTIYKVAASIIKFETEFLDNGIDFLQPLVLRDVANDIGMHESTVSRVVNDKYMHTPQGVFEMRFFFHRAVDGLHGESISSVRVKQRIRSIVESENPNKPLSDSRIGRILETDGLMLARRTIAKYRDEQRIPPSTQRRRLD